MNKDIKINQMQEPESEHISLMFNTFFQTWNTGCRSHRVQVEQFMWHVRWALTWLLLNRWDCRQCFQENPLFLRLCFHKADSPSYLDLTWKLDWGELNFSGSELRKAACWSRVQQDQQDCGSTQAAAVRKFIHDKTNDSIYLKTFEDLWELQ